MKEITRREFLILFGRLGVNLGVGLGAGLGMSSVFRHREKEVLPEIKLLEILDSMRRSKTAQLQETADAYNRLLNGQVKKLVITDHFEFKQEPVDLWFVGGLENGDSDLQIVVSQTSLVEGRLSKESWVIYLYKTMLLFKIVDVQEGTAQQELVALSNRVQLETQIWNQVWETVGENFARKVSDKYLQALLQDYKLSSQKFK